MNFARGDRDGDPLNKVDKAEELWQWVDGYCRSHPDDSAQKAGTRLYLELCERAQ